nr:unnamed protein product [Callosobruchus chinensis]
MFGIISIFNHLLNTVNYILKPIYYYWLTSSKISGKNVTIHTNLICCLRYTQCKLELVKSIEQLMFIEEGIRGGISACSSRFSEANNKYMSNYDPSKASSYLPPLPRL